MTFSGNFRFFGFVRLCPGNEQSLPAMEKNWQRLKLGPPAGYPVWQSHLGSVYGLEMVAVRDLANRRKL